MLSYRLQPRILRAITLRQYPQHPHIPGKSHTALVAINNPRTEYTLSIAFFDSKNIDYSSFESGSTTTKGTFASID